MDKSSIDGEFFINKSVLYKYRRKEHILERSTMNYYNEIKEKAIKIELYDKAKDYAKDRNKVIVYFEIGKLLNEAGKEYGKNIIKRYSEKLKQEVGKKYNERNLRYMRQLYEIIIKIKWNTLCSKLCWSHYREILSLKNEND